MNPADPTAKGRHGKLIVTVWDDICHLLSLFMLNFCASLLHCCKIQRLREWNWNVPKDDLG